METWKEIPGYPGYEVSDLGRVRSLDRVVPQPRWGTTMRVSGVVLSPGKVRGYYRVSLSSGGKSSQKSVHILVLETFIGPCPQGCEARHLNGDRTDNRLGNLKWGTKSENTHDQVSHGTHRNTKKITCPRGHELVTPNLVTASLAKGQRVCRTCSITKHRADKDFDQVYSRVMSNRISNSKTCKRGHLKEGPNVYVVSTRPNNKLCLACKKALAANADNVQLESDNIYENLMKEWYCE